MESYSCKLFWLNAYNSYNNPYLLPDQVGTMSKSRFRPFTSLPFCFTSTEEVTGVEPVLVPNTGKTYYSRHVYTQGHSSVFQTPPINSWPDLGKKQGQVSAEFNIYPNRFQKGKHSKKTLGLKLKVILESIQFQQLRVNPGCLNCQTVCSAFFSGMDHQFFLFFCTMVDNWNI